MRRAVPGMLRPPTDATATGRTWPTLPVLFIGALLLRLHGLGDKPYWLDEVTTLRRAALPLLPLVRDSLVFHHLPLFFVIASWFEPFGLDPATMRLPAALFGAAACAIAFLVGRSVAGTHCGLLAGVLLAVSPFQIQYAQEARSYTLVTCFILCGVWGLSRLAVKPRGDRAGWLLYAIGTALALDTLSVALFWFAAAQIGAVLVARRSVATGWRWFARVWIPVQAAVLLAYLPFVAAMVRLTHGQMGAGLDWVPPPTAQTVWSTLQAVFLLRRSSLIAFRIFPGAADLFGVPWLGLCVLLLAAFGVARGRGSPGVRVVLLAVLALPVGVALCSLRSSLWMPRYLLWSSPMLFLLAGVGVAFLPRRPALLVIALAGGVGLINLLPYYGDETKPLWNEAAFLLQDAWKPGDLILTDDPAAIGMMNVAIDPHSAIAGVVPGIGFHADQWTIDPATALDGHRAGRRVWIVHGRVGQNDSDRLETLLDSAAGLGAPSNHRFIGLDIVLLRFDPPAPADGKPS